MAESISNVYICHVDFEKDLAHTLYFHDEAEQRSYFFNKKIHQMQNASYVRQDKNIRVNLAYDRLLANGANYVCYQNPAYDNRWFFAFITSMDYYSAGMTDVKIETDVLQTWRKEIKVLPSFVEREHVADDTPGMHTFPEGLEIGEFVVNSHQTSGYSGYNSLSIVLAATEEPDGEGMGGQLVNRSYSGVGYYAYPLREQLTETMPDYIGALNSKINRYIAEGKQDAIIGIFVAPTRLAPTDINQRVQAEEWEVDRFYINDGSAGLANVVNIDFSDRTLDGHVAKNNKLLTHPYRYLMIDNNAGACVPYRYEDFYLNYQKTDGTIEKRSYEPTFIIEGALTLGCSIRMIPLYYKGEGRNDAEGINMGKFPICSWASDAFTNWLTQNGVNIAIQIGTGVVQIAGGVAAIVGTSGAGAVLGGGSIVGGVTTIANTLSQVHQQSFTPDQARGNVNSGDVVTASNQNDFHFYQMSIKKEYAQIVDAYFSAYGYKINCIKQPETNHRRAFWYTKLIEPNITGAIPQEDMKKIKEAYTRGITFWRQTSKFKDYTQENSIYIS